MIFSPMEQFALSAPDNAFLTSSLLSSPFVFLVSFCFQTALILAFVMHSVQLTRLSSAQNSLLGGYEVSKELVKMSSLSAPKTFQGLVFCVFAVILLLNLVGLLPFVQSITAQIVVTISLALIINLAVLMRGVNRLGLRFLSTFLPKDVPAPIMPLLVLIETVSYALKTLTLAIRLFANITAGHILLAIVCAFAVGALAKGQIVLEALGITLFLFSALLVLLELGVAFIQSIVFSLLCSLYISDSDSEH
nr:ATP synthase F0 subunit 6 [Chroodactylon ornatum]